MIQSLYMSWIRLNSLSRNRSSGMNWILGRLYEKVLLEKYRRSSYSQWTCTATYDKSEMPLKHSTYQFQSRTNTRRRDHGSLYEVNNNFLNSFLGFSEIYSMAIGLLPKRFLSNQWKIKILSWSTFFCSSYSEQVNTAELNKLCMLEALEPGDEFAWAWPTLSYKKDGSARFVTDVRKLH